MHISSAGLALIKEFEGFRSHPYWDPNGRVWTVGYGETHGVTAHAPILSEHEASALLERRIRRDFEPYVRAVGVPLNQHQFDALCSFVYNLGPLYLQRGHTMGDDLRGRHYHAAADAFLLYDTSGGQVLEGLKRRREMERSLFLKVPPHPPSRNQRLAAAWQARLTRLRLRVRGQGHWTQAQMRLAKELEADIRRHGGTPK
jgi:lysozyme